MRLVYSYSFTMLDSVTVLDLDLEYPVFFVSYSLLAFFRCRFIFGAVVLLMTD